MRLRLGDAPYLPLPISTDATVTVAVTFARDIRGGYGPVDKCEVATLVGLVRQALEDNGLLAHRMAEQCYAQVDIEAYEPTDESYNQVNLTYDGVTIRAT